MVQRISRAFKDISLSFDRHPITNDILNIKNEDAIKKAVRNIVRTVPSERFFNPIFGSDVKTSLFEFVDFGTASELEDQILVAIENYEPRISNIQVRVDPNADRNEFEVFISYNIVGQEVPPQKFSFILEATR